MHRIVSDNYPNNFRIRASCSEAFSHRRKRRGKPSTTRLFSSRTARYCSNKPNLCFPHTTSLTRPAILNPHPPSISFCSRGKDWVSPCVRMRGTIQSSFPRGSTHAIPWTYWQKKGLRYSSTYPHLPLASGKTRCVTSYSTIMPSGTRNPSFW